MTTASMSSTANAVDHDAHVLHAVDGHALDGSGTGVVTNARHAEFRAAQYTREYFDRGYEIKPPLKDWEIERH
ncbi:MAG: hypothetical protein E6G08_20880 [Actinobacteria bacterium]|nr:MAG: hypothetical protein E6G08_20880 [Actinomycetota bacterium]